MKTLNVIDDTEKSERNSLQSPNEINTWGSSFGTTPTPVGHVVNCSPLSSWFLSNGQANFIRESNASYMNLKGHDIEHVYEMSTTEKEFYDKLAKNQWRNWYRSESNQVTNSLLDPPLQNIPFKIQETVDAVNSISKVGKITRSRESISYEKMMDLLREEKEASTSFEQQMIQILQGNTLNGKPFEEAYHNVLKEL